MLEFFSDHRRATVLAAAVNGVVIADARKPGFPTVYANPGFTRLTGYTPEEIYGRPCSVLQADTTDPQAVEALRRALELKREARVTLLNRRKDGSHFWNESSSRRSSTTRASSSSTSASRTTSARRAPPRTRPSSSPSTTT